MPFAAHYYRKPADLQAGLNSSRLRNDPKGGVAEELRRVLDSPERQMARWPAYRHLESVDFRRC